MINLIPKQEEERIIKDFYLRVFAVFFLILGFAVSIASIAILPSYIYSTERKDFIIEKLEEMTSEPAPGLNKKADDTIKAMGAMTKIIEDSEKNNYLVTEKIIDQVLAKKTPDIKITKIFYNTSPDGKEVEISGVAKSREDLLVFRRLFESDVNFKKVDLPISNFVKGSNIIFYLNLIPS